MGAIINANIFGQLSVIYSSNVLNIINEKFMTKFAIINTVMEELKLPTSIKLPLRYNIITTEPSL